MTKPLVSVVIATCNRANLLEGALASLAQQDYRPLEVVVVDDGSRDDTRSLLKRLYKEWKNNTGLVLRHATQRNRGPARARNRGAALAQGERVLFMDDDDLMARDAIRHLAAALEENPEAGISLGSYASVGANFDPAELDSPDLVWIPAMPSQQVWLEQMIAGQWFVPIHGIMFTREALDRLGGWNAELSTQEDDELMLRAALAGIQAVAAPAARVVYRQHNGVRRSRADATTAPRRLRDDLRIREWVWEELQARESSMREWVPAFEAWYQRLSHRYGPLVHQVQTSLLLQWLRRKSTLVRVPEPLPTRTAPAVASVRTASAHRPVKPVPPKPGKVDAPWLAAGKEHPSPTRERAAGN